MNNVLNNNDTQLDLIFSNNPLINVLPLDNSIVPLDKHHPILTTEYTIPDCGNHTRSNTLYLDYRKANYKDMNFIFGNNDWSCVYKENNINIALNNFYKIVLDTIKKTVPEKISWNHKFPRWFSKELCILIKNKKRIHKLFKTSGLSIHYTEFSVIRKKCKLLTKLCYEKHLEKIQSPLSKNPKHFWKFLKNRQQSLYGRDVYGRDCKYI